MTDAIGHQPRNQLNITPVQRPGHGERGDGLGRLHREKMHWRCILWLISNCIIHDDALFPHLPSNSHSNKDKPTKLEMKSHITHISTYKPQLHCRGRGWFAPQACPCQLQVVLPLDFSIPLDCRNAYVSGWTCSSQATAIPSLTGLIICSQVVSRQPFQVPQPE